MSLLKTKLTTCFAAKNRRKQLLHICLLSVWALIQYSLGNKIYGLFIIAFFLVFAMSRRPNFVLVAIPVLVIVLFTTPTLDTGAQLKQWNLNTVQNYKRTLINVFSPDSGQQVLPATVRQMLSLIISNHITSYQLSSQLYQDSLIMQRIVESAWPIKMDSTSPYLFLAPEETNNNSTCVVIDHRKDVALAYCQ